MGIYIGKSKQTLIVGNVTQNMKVLKQEEIVVANNRLMSSDNYILMDRNDLYLTTKDGEQLWR